MPNESGSVLDMPLADVLVRTAETLQEIITEAPSAIKKGPEAVTALIMAPERRQFLGVALAGAALILLLFAC
jgi:hypothetical protein